MNQQIRADQAFDSWLADGPTRMPAHLVDSIVNQLEETHQRKHWWLPGREQMNRMMVAVGGVAAIALVAVLGFYFLGRGVGIGGVATPSATPTPTPIPTVTPAAQRVPPADFVTLVPGRYVDHVGAYDYTFSVPAGWMSAGGAGLVVSGSNFNQSSADFGANSADFASLGLPTWWKNPEDSAEVYTDPCRSLTSGIATGKSAADLAAAIAQIAPMNPSVADDISISGLNGKHIRLTVPTDVDFSTCDRDQYWSVTSRFYQGLGQVDEFWILDLPGGGRQIFGISYMPATTQAVRDQLHEMISSMTIE